MSCLLEAKVSSIAFPSAKHPKLITLARKYPLLLYQIAQQIDPNLVTLTQQFLYDQLNPHNNIAGATVHPSHLPRIVSNIKVYHSTIATFYAPSNYSGEGGMYRERIHATPLWNKGDIHGPRYDCILIDNDASLPCFAGLAAARLCLLFSFLHAGIYYPCALVEWYTIDGTTPDSTTGYWILKPKVARGQRVQSVIHLDCIMRGAHLMPVFGDEFVPRTIDYTMSLDFFRSFYLNHHIDPHAFEVIHSSL